MTEITLREVETASDPRYAVIWLHGLGADASDFEPVVPELRVGRESCENLGKIT